MSLTLEQLIEPRISIVICNYNHADYLAYAIESALAQTRPAQEIIVVDDGSTDESPLILEQYSARGVKCLTQSNGGQRAAYNSGFQCTTGDVVVFLDADDALDPRALEAVSTRFTQGVAKVHFWLRIIGEDGAATGGRVPRRLASGDVATRLLKRGVMHASPPASGNAYRRSVLAHLFPLPVDQYDRHGADYFCIYGSTLFGSVSACREVLGSYRVSASVKQALVIGNAGQKYDAEQRSARRYALLRQWISERSQGTLRLPSDTSDFYAEKAVFASAALARGPREVPRRLLRWRQFVRCLVVQDLSPAMKIGFLTWSMLVLGAPRTIAFRAAQYVCNPSSRSSPSESEAVVGAVE